MSLPIYVKIGIEFQAAPLESGIECKRFKRKINDDVVKQDCNFSRPETRDKKIDAVFFHDLKRIYDL